MTMVTWIWKYFNLEQHFLSTSFLLRSYFSLKSDKTSSFLIQRINYDNFKSEYQTPKIWIHLNSWLFNVQYSMGAKSFFFFFFLFMFGPPKEDIFSDHLPWSIFQSSLHTYYKLQSFSHIHVLGRGVKGCSYK